MFVALGVSLTVTVVLLAVGGAASSWTGFRGKTLWDLLQLLIVPLVLATPPEEGLATLLESRGRRLDGAAWRRRHSQGRQPRRGHGGLAPPLRTPHGGSRRPRLRSFPRLRLRQALVYFSGQHFSTSAIFAGVDGSSSVGTMAGPSNGLQWCRPDLYPRSTMREQLRREREATRLSS
jgi:hypothetical protein